MLGRSDLLKTTTGEFYLYLFLGGFSSLFSTTGINTTPRDAPVSPSGGSRASLKKRARSAKVFRTINKHTDAQRKTAQKQINSTYLPE